MLVSEIKQRLIQAWRATKQEFLEELEKIPLTSEIKERLVQAWKSGKQSFLEDVERIKIEMRDIVRMPPLETKITMLGTTGTGKTCYMIGMSIWMQTKGINGFTITSENHNQSRKIRNQWNDMTKKQGSERWPAGNAEEPLPYSFNFNYAAKTFARFDWLDYRGGALPDVEEAADRKILVERLLNSDCIFLCISAEYLALAADEEDTFEAAMEAEVDTMNSLLTAVDSRVKPTSVKPFPVAIVVTKADLLANSSIQEKGVETVKEFFKNTLFVKPHWLTAIIPVSLGQELARNPDSGRIKPVGVHLPVTFAVLCKLIKERNGQARPSSDWRAIIERFSGENKDVTDINTQIKNLDAELGNIWIYAGDRQISSLLEWAKM
jgi:GTPase SAR1 family protein